MIEREGTTFVLDYGEARLVAEANRLVLHGGFTVRWQDRAETAIPGSPSLMRQLALYYAARGYLVFADEPDFPRRPPAPITAPITAPVVSLDGPPTLLPDEPTGHDLDTEILTLSDLEKRLQRVAAEEEAERLLEESSSGLEWDETEELTVGRELRPRR